MDKNFTQQAAVAEDSVLWYDARALSLYGLAPEDPLSLRIPKEIAKQVNENVLFYHQFSAGGRVRFSTNSPFVALRVTYGPGSLSTVNNHCLTYGFDLYRDEDGIEVFTAAGRPVAGFDRKSAQYNLLTQNGGKTEYYTLNLPAFSSVASLQIGIEEGSIMGPGKPYRNEKPVIFYGSSITHGAAAGRPGNTYENFIAQKYNIHYRNMGFSGGAKGEQKMADFLAELPMRVFVCDYDHNAPTAEHLRKTHYKLYETIRQANPDVPYIMISRPTFYANPQANGKRRQVILDTYEKALALGDEKVFFIDGETLFEGDFSRSCTSDGIHPNDLGFFRMAQKIGPVVNQALTSLGL